MKKIILGVVGSFVGLVMISAVTSSWFTIDQGERGVVLRNGAVIGVADPGLHFKLPWIDDVRKISLQQQSLRWDASEDTEMQAYSQDQQPADLAVSVNYRVNPADVTAVYIQFGTLENMESKLLLRIVPQQIKTVFGQYNAVSVIQNRAKFNADVTDAVTQAIPAPAVIDGVQVENIDFSNAYEAAVEARMQAQVDVQKREQELQRERIQAQITVMQAQAVADSTLARRKADAEGIRIQGEAEAAAIKARAEALGQNPNLIALTQAEKWDGRLPTTMLPGGSVPFLDISR